MSEQLIPVAALKLPKHISYSSWMEFRNICQHRWMLNNILKIRQKIYSIHMDFGTAVHRALELSRCKKPILTKEQAIVRFERIFRLLYRWHRSLYREKERDMDPQFFLDAGRVILDRFGECKKLAEAKVLFNELALYEPISRTDGTTTFFKGFVDMIVMSKDGRGKPVLYVCDFKSCSWGWPREKLQDRELHYQILLYKHFICKKFDLDPKQTRTAFVLLKKKPRPNSSPVEFVPISAGPVSVQRALDELNKDITRMVECVASNSFHKNTKSCVSDFGDVCPYDKTDHCVKE